MSTLHACVIWEWHHTVTTNPQHALACDRNLISLIIPLNLLQSWKYFDSGPSMDRILMLTTDENLDFPCWSVRLCGDGAFKASLKLWTQLYTVHGQKNGFLCLCSASRQTQGDVHSTLQAIEILVDRVQCNMGFRVILLRLWEECLPGCKRRVSWYWRGEIFSLVKATGFPCRTTWINAQVPATADRLLRSIAYNSFLFSYIKIFTVLILQFFESI